MDSNHDKSLQRALCYHYTIGQCSVKVAISPVAATKKSNGRQCGAISVLTKSRRFRSWRRACGIPPLPELRRASRKRCCVLFPLWGSISDGFLSELLRDDVRRPEI